MCNHRSFPPFLRCSTKLSKDQNHGMVYGQLMWNGQLKPKVERIPGTNKKEWTLLELPDYHTFKG
jgi:hypothetical protein